MRKKKQNKVMVEMQVVELDLRAKDLSFLKKLAKKTKLSIDVIIQTLLVNHVLQKALEKK